MTCGWIAVWPNSIKEILVLCREGSVWNSSKILFLGRVFCLQVSIKALKFTEHNVTFFRTKLLQPTTWTSAGFSDDDPFILRVFAFKTLVSKLRSFEALNTSIFIWAIKKKTIYISIVKTSIIEFIASMNLRIITSDYLGIYFKVWDETIYVSRHH